MVNAGRILILAKGAWSATTNYTQLDLVSYNSIAYLARQASVGVNPAQDTQMSYWMPFGSAASIATTSTPGLVMPDGTTITITNTGLIKAVLGVNDISDVVITSPTNGQVLKYNSATQKWENGSLGTAANKDATNTISSGSTDLIESGAVHSAIETLTTQINKAYKSDDSSETTIDGADYIPFYDSSASAMKKILVRNADFGSASKADKTDLTSISQTGTTATQAIAKGEYFYLNGTLVKAKASIASGATFTLNTNYESVTDGGLNEARKSYTFPPNATKIYTPIQANDFSTLSWEYTATQDCVAVCAANNTGSTSPSTMYLIVTIDNVAVFSNSALFTSTPPNYAYNRAFTVSLAKGQKIKVSREAASGQYFSTINGIYI